MDRWIRDLINAATSGLTALVNAVADRITWVYNVFITFGIKVRSAFDGALNGIITKLTALVGMVREAYVTMHWLIFIRIPQVVGNAVSSATNFLLQQLNNAQLFLRGIIDGVTAWIVQQVQRIDSFISQVINWAAMQINAIINTLTRVADIVGNLLTDPRRLAAWAIDAIIGEFLLWLDRNADRVWLIVRQRSVQLTMQAVDKVEDMIARLL